jgi:hypothetical protein
MLFSPVYIECHPRPVLTFPTPPAALSFQRWDPQTSRCPDSVPSSVSVNSVPSAVGARPDRVGVLYPVLLFTDHGPPITDLCPPKSLPFNLFAAPHPLTPHRINLLQKHSGEGAPNRPGTPHSQLITKSFRCHTSGPFRKCGKQRTYTKPKSFSCHTYKKPGVGVLLLTRNPKNDLYPERPSGTERPLFT